ncbi:MAG: adenylyl-sulfate kinase [Kofleriaceae bacterium]
MAGAVVWLTGLSGSGKTTLAHAAAKLVTCPVEIMDGDEIREFLSEGLGFSKEDRDTNSHRIGFVARLLAKHGVLVFVASIAPYRDTRAELARRSVDAGHPFVEVYVHAPLEVVADRDVKGLYKKALAGKIDHFTGVSDPYEAPEHPALVVHTHEESLDESARRLVELLRSRSLL